MWLSSVSVRGLAEPIDESLERVGRIQHPSILADALLLATGALDLERAPEAARAVGWPCAEAEGQLELTEPYRVSRCVEPAVRPQVSIELVVQPDPPLYGRLRDGALRDPQLAEGLSAGTLTVRLGWLFTRDLGFASPDLLGVALGDRPVPLAEMPRWLPDILRELATRIGVLDWRVPNEAVAAGLFRASMSSDPEQRARAARALEAAEALGTPLALIHESGPALLTGDLRPLHWAGPRPEAVARLVHAVFVEQPDVLVVRGGVDGDLSEWLESQLEGDDATLEQVLL